MLTNWRYKLKGTIRWCLNWKNGWVGFGDWIIRWNTQWLDNTDYDLFAIIKMKRKNAD